jgi:Ni,Fe-hydrogenase III large subunit
MRIPRTKKCLEEDGFMLSEFLTFHNADALWQRDIPVKPILSMVEHTHNAIQSGARFVQWFGKKTANNGIIRIYAVLADDTGQKLGVMVSDVATGSSYPALSATIPAADRAERELFEQCGIRPEGHPWLKPVRHPVAKATLNSNRVLGEVPENNIGRHYPFWELRGDVVHEVGVGPIHAGIIGPGYFRFSCVGEQIEHLEIMLGFEHRGVEEMILKAKPAKVPILVESIAGDTCIGYSTAYAQAMESLTGIRVGARVEALRALALENERMAYHIGDLGALAGDVAYFPTTAYFGRIRGDFLNTAVDLCGNRQGRYFVRPGGIQRDLSQAVQEGIIKRMTQTKAEIHECLDQMFTNLSVASRFDRSGCVSRENAIAFGFIGQIARASGLALDIRSNHPTGYWEHNRLPVAISQTGSVMDRAIVRKIEVEHSLEEMLKILQSLPDHDGEILKKCQPGSDLRGDFCVSMTEGWRGQIVQTLILNESGQLEHYKSQDPSFQNWNAMQLANRGNAISDFPVCNKSCNLAYNGHDL